MKVRTRSRLILVITIVIFLAVLSFISESVILASFSAIETQEMTSHVQRAVSSLDGQEDNLATICDYWASQQEMADFAAGLGTGTEPQNTDPVQGYDADFVLVYNSSGALAYAARSGIRTPADDPEIQDLSSIIRGSIIPEGFPVGIAGRYGMSSLGGVPVIVAGSPIAAASGQDQPDGTLILAQALTEDRLRAMENSLQVPAISLHPYVPSENSTLSGEEIARIEKGGIIARAADADRFEGMTAITGIENTPTFLILRVETGRPVYHQVQESLSIFAGVIIVFSVIFLIAVQLLMQRFVLSPISSLDNEMKLIGRDSEISRRVDETGDEEIASLKRSLNRMLDEIQHYHEELRASQETLGERNQHLAELNRKANLYLDIYLDVITYEILNALMGLRGYADLIRSTATGREAEFAEKIGSIVKKSSEVIRNIETISRIYKNPPKNRPVSLGLVLRNEVQLYPDLAIRTENCETTVMANEMLGVIFSNLFSNSLKYGGPDVTVDVRCRDTGDGFVEVSVEDTGPGIPDGMKEKVFDRFAADKKTRSSYGLGLHIVKMLVEGYGGRVRADDRVPEEPAKGAAIRFTLRLANGSPEEGDTGNHP